MPWGDLIRIVSVKRYKKAESIPTWKYMDKRMKISVKMGKRYGNSKWDYIIARDTNNFGILHFD